MTKQKRGGVFLLEETLRILIAALIIGGLFYILISLYISNANKKALDQAESTLNYILQEANAGNTTLEVYNPKGWYLLSWPHEVRKRLEMPKSCSNLGWVKCLCICEEEGGDECDELGKCVESSLGVRGYKIEIKPPMVLEIKSNVIEIK
jgi:hypothetical protein